MSSAGLPLDDAGSELIQETRVGEFSPSPENGSMVEALARFAGWIIMLSGLLWIVLLWPSNPNTAVAQVQIIFAFVIGISVSLSAIFPFGLAKIIRTLDKIEGHLRENTN